MVMKLMIDKASATQNVTKMQLALIAALIFLCTGCAPQNNESESYRTPWSSLTGEEISSARDVIRSEFGDKVLFNRISLAPPEKKTALAWKPGDEIRRDAEVAFGRAGEFFVARIDLNTGKLTGTRPLKNGQPMFSPDGELTPLILKLTQYSDVAKALQKRGAQPDDVFCAPRTVGRFFADKTNNDRARLLRVDCFYIANSSALSIYPSRNVWARPIEGLTILFDVNKQQIIEIEDSYADGKAPPFKIDMAEFHSGALEARRALNPIEHVRPRGRNFTIKGEQIRWQGWQFHLRFDARRGAIINHAGIETKKGLRPVAYEIGMSEMFVPYQDEQAHWFYRAYFDMSEYGLGNMATELQKADCPDHAILRHAVLHLANGDPYIAENRLCIFEHDPNIPIWRHHETILDDVPGLDPHESRRATELIVRMVATVGNYDYFQDYIFQQDGRMRIRITSTGIDAVKGAFSSSLADRSAKKDVETGTLIAPHRIAVNHDHFFNYRIDLDVDGPSNNFNRDRLVQKKLSPKSPRQGIWTIDRRRIKREAAAQTIIDPGRPSVLTFSSARQKNAMGYHSAYQLVIPPVRPIVSLKDQAYQRAAFVKNNLWVTKYKRSEIFAAGEAVNQSRPLQGLPHFIKDNENITNADLVAWVTLGFHHVPVAEDWPVLPSKVAQIVLKPRNFFDHNPSIDLPD